MSRRPQPDYESGRFEAVPVDRDANDERRERYDSAARDYAQFVDPHGADLLEQLGLDKCFVRAEGNVLFDADGTQYLDALSGWGAVPFGHNPDWLWEAVREVERAREPAMAQSSLLPGAGELAEALIRHAPPGLRYVAFGGTGADALDSAIEACRSATGKAGILVAGSCAAAHGRFGGAKGGARPGLTRAVPYGDAASLDRALEEWATETAALVVEATASQVACADPPIGYLQAARGLCDRHGVLLVVDEVDAGLGRTGALFASAAEGVRPDAVALGEALGGGLLPVSACLLGPRAYSEGLALVQRSTFAGGALAMRVGLRVLERLTGDDGRLLDAVLRHGHYLKRGLRALQLRYGSAIRDVRGRGLLLGVELAAGADASPLSAVSHLLNQGRVRVGAPASGAAVLRVQPPLTVTREECDWILEAFRELASSLAAAPSEASRLPPKGVVRPDGSPNQISMLTQ